MASPATVSAPTRPPRRRFPWRRPGSWAGEVAALGMIAASALFLHRDGLTGGATFYESDTRLFYLPLASWVGEQLRSGVYPLWLPGIFTGYPIFADGELGLLYLPQVLALWLVPAPLALVWLRALHVFLAGAFTYAFLRASVRVEPLPALGGALVFAFGSFLTTQMQHENVIRSAVWLPLVLLLVDRALRPAPVRRRAGWIALAALVFAQSALGLHVQPVLMAALAIGWLAVFRALTQRAFSEPAGRPPTPSGGAGSAALPVAIAPRAPGRIARWQAAVRRNRAAVMAWRASTRPRWVLAVTVGTVGGGLLLAAAQWLPLLELALVSFRRSGVDYGFASAFSLTGQNLPTLLFPYFFRLPDGATWWMVWQSWETLLYVGVPTLALAVVGAVFSWRREALFFLLLGGGALMVGLSVSAPFVNLHELLWSLPGFSFLRAPGRFSYLVVFAAAGLAALGLQALTDRRARANRLGVAVAGAVPAGALALVVAVAFPLVRGWLAADPDRGRALLARTYLDLRTQYAMDPRMVYEGMLASLDLTGPKSAWSLALLVATALLFIGWLALGPRRGRLAQAVFVAAIGVDLLVFAADFHPRAALASLATPPLEGVPPGARVLVRSGGALPALEPNALLSAGVTSVEGYSSLPSQRYAELYDATRRFPALQPIWSAPYVVEPKLPADARSAGGVSFRPGYPLVAGYAGATPTRFRVPADLGTINAIRVVGTLSYAFDVEQGTSVAELVLRDEANGQVVLPLRAGIEIAERAFDRPSLAPLLRHGRPPLPPALDFPDYADGEDYTAHLYLADMPLPAPARFTSVEVRPLHDRALVQIQGIGLVNDSGVRSLGLLEREGMRLLSETADYQVLADDAALPRAYVRPRDGAVYRVGRPSTTLAEVMTSPSFRPDSNFLLEWAEVAPGIADPVQLAGETLYVQNGELWRVQTWRNVATGESWDTYDQVGSATETPTGFRAAQVEDLGPNAVRIRARADVPSYLVLDDFYQRGWAAWVDGQPAPINIANALFRAVALEPGDHVIEMRFQPLSHLVGAGLSVIALLTALAVIAVGFRRPR